MDLGRQGSVDELLGNLDAACDHFHSARLLIESIMISTNNTADKKILKSYLMLFESQYHKCSKALNDLKGPNHLNIEIRHV